MEAWPVEEVWIRPLGSLVLAALVPAATSAVMRRFLDADAPLLAQALWPMRAVQLCIAWVVGITALGPALVAAPVSAESQLFACACLGVAIASDFRWAAVDTETRPVPLATALVLAPMAGALIASPWVGLPIVFVAGALAFRPGQPTPMGLAIGGAGALFLVAAVALPASLTTIARTDARDAGDARWRLRLHPWDEDAMLASAWESRRRGEHDRAVAQGREAQRMGLPAGPALELEAEVLAARGECERARSTFDRAIRARAESAFDEDAMDTPLTLGGFQLPPTMIRECGGLEDLPGLGELPPITPP